MNQSNTPNLIDEFCIKHQLEILVDRIAFSGHKCKSLGLSFGKMGIVIFLFHYARQIKDVSFENAAVKFINEIMSDIHFSIPLNYAHGLSGIGTGIEYLAQHDFLEIDTDETLTGFDRLFVEQIQKRKLYLSAQYLMDLKRFFTARLENSQTKKRDFLNKAKIDILSLLELHHNVSFILEDTTIQNPFPDDAENFGLEGLSGKGLLLLTTLNPQHNTWLKLR